MVYQMDECVFHLFIYTLYVNINTALLTGLPALAYMYLRDSACHCLVPELLYHSEMLFR